MSDEEAKDQFRMTSSNIVRLTKISNLPSVTITCEGVRSDPVEALAICLRRLVFPHRWIDMAAMLGRAPSTICHIFYFVVEFLDKNLSKMLYFYIDRISKNIDRYCKAISSKEKRSIKGVWGFIDGTVRPMCRPGKCKGQQAVYNGHKREHAFKYQTIVTPDGLISHVFGPVDGRRHDIFMLNESGLKDVLEANAVFHKKIVYGDPAYGCTNVFCCPFKGCRIDIPKKELNKAMSSVRVSVEWAYGQITRNFAYLDFKREQRAAITPIATLYKMGVLFTNCVTIANGSNTNSNYCRCAPPTFQEYFQSYTQSISE
ncbi:hypothetical protein Ae201684P_011837 [Aphanomyces euteiches]|uniref:DDE Tnp4 domain-containing protein n=1 Tax=Aphanomyces euteiches TaxID=100861 RepID=A0A6G0WUT8_9STRA|nr:hypothetical protein Ae201684_011426 [Aphanomyces euteiches]KAH9097108.1 hypothetical protein Ae201684P_011837 [Aphanomyces euteiches]